MQSWKFLSNRGEFVVVEALDERRAREAAMLKLHGQPDRPWLPRRWTGRGLMLREEPA